MKIIKYIFLIIFIVMIIIGVTRGLKGQRIKDYTDKATEYGLRGENEKAIEYYQKVISEDPSITGAYLGIGVIYFTQKNDAKALEYCNKAVTIDPQIKLTKAYGFCDILQRTGNK